MFYAKCNNYISFGGAALLRILFVNKFLYLNGGTETYIFKLGNYFASQGHKVQYFGMSHKYNVVGNRVGAYTSYMDFHNSGNLEK